MKRVLAPGGALVLHLGSPVFHGAQVAELVRSLRQQFAGCAATASIFRFTALTGAGRGLR
jgi:hypothetical protein